MYHCIIHFIEFRCRLPWNQESFFGYIGEIGVDFIVANNFIFIAGQFFLLFISICVHVFTFNKMFGSFTNELDDSNEAANKFKSIRKLIDFHMEIKECVTIFMQFYWLVDRLFCLFRYWIVPGFFSNQVTHFPFILAQYLFGIFLVWHPLFSSLEWYVSSPNLLSCNQMCIFFCSIDIWTIWLW